MISALGLWISRVVRQTCPDPMVIAILLTLVVIVLALLLGDFGAAGTGAAPTMAENVGALIRSWGANTGMWAFLAFSMQMCLVLVTGYALAATPPVKAVIARLATIPAGGASAAALVGAMATGAAVLNWGFGLIVGALLAREVGRSLAARRIPHHYPLIVAAGYTGLMVWHGGLSGSAPLSMTDTKEAAKVLAPQFLERLGERGVPLSETLFSPLNFLVTGGLLILTPVVLALLAPRKTGDMIACPPDLEDPPAPGPRAAAGDGEPGSPPTLPDRLDASRTMAWCLAGLLLASLHTFVPALTGSPRSVLSLGLNDVNVIMLALGLVLHGSVRAYIGAVEEACRGCAGIILQFPLYAGIMAMMVASGLVGLLARGMTDFATPGTLPVFTFLSAGVLNLFVPSGGGQWGVQGPIAMTAAATHDVPIGRMIMAVAYGDQLTNMLQPFWALPLLAITKVKARDIVGYTCVVMLAGGAWIAACLLVF